jgi:hypothetical protein
MRSDSGRCSSVDNRRRRRAAIDFCHGPVVVVFDRFHHRRFVFVDLQFAHRRRCAGSFGPTIGDNNNVVMMRCDWSGGFAVRLCRRDGGRRRNLWRGL